MQLHVLVFCGHKFGNDPAFIHAMHGVGQMLAENGMPMVYGGSEEGLMGVGATAAIGHNGTVIGIIPQFLQEKEKPLEALKQPPHQLTVTKTMSERKDLMFTMAHAIITGPGGPGTRDEFWEAVTNRQVGQFKKPNIVLNVNGCFDSLEGEFAAMIRDGFMDPELKPPFVTSVEDILPHLLRARSKLEAADNLVRLHQPQSAAG